MHQWKNFFKNRLIFGEDKDKSKVARFLAHPVYYNSYYKKFDLMLTRRAKAYSMQLLANNGKITTFTGVPLFDALVRRFPWT